MGNYRWPVLFCASFVAGRLAPDVRAAFTKRVHHSMRATKIESVHRGFQVRMIDDQILRLIGSTTSM